ncbi:MAG: GNAT family N-acetyltransferase [Myxococcales bacterium]|nr:GNAT family N-acetyltransferase [Myxococcales bacterium]
MTRELVVPDDGERAAFAPIVALAFGTALEDIAPWFERAGFPNLRVLSDGDRVLGGLLRVPMAQWFGGRSVATNGVAGVAVAAEERGAGVAGEMMRSFLRETRARGVPLSTLYPATVPLYQRAGYERAGARHRVSVLAERLVTGERGLSVTPLLQEDPEVLALHATFAARRDGYLDRGPYLWDRIFRPRKGQHHAFGVRGPHSLEGYVVYTNKQEHGHDTEIQVLDLVAATGRAVRRLLQLLSDHRSLANRVTWHGASPDVFTMALPDRRHELVAVDHWMLRIVDLPTALGERGFPRVPDGVLELDVEDEVLPDNAGRWRVVVEGGRAKVARGGSGALRLDVRALAALYSGYLSVHALAQLDRVDGTANTLDAADRLFPPGNPCMGDMF